MKQESEVRGDLIRTWDRCPIALDLESIRGYNPYGRKNRITRRFTLQKDQFIWTPDVDLSADLPKRMALIGYRIIRPEAQEGQALIQISRTKPPQLLRRDQINGDLFFPDELLRNAVVHELKPFGLWVVLGRGE